MLAVKNRARGLFTTIPGKYWVTYDKILGMNEPVFADKETLCAEPHVVSSGELVKTRWSRSRESDEGFVPEHAVRPMEINTAYWSFQP